MAQDKSNRNNELTREQLLALVDHYQQFIGAQTEINNGLISRLHNSETFADADRATLNQWSLVVNDLHTASEAQVMTIVGGTAPPTVN